MEEVNDQKLGYIGATRDVIVSGARKLRMRNPLRLRPDDHSTVTDFARLRGWSTSVPMKTAVW